METEKRIVGTRNTTFSGPIEPTVLTTHRDSVDERNSAKLLALPGEAREFTANDINLTESEQANCQLPTKLVLKIGYA